MVLLYLNDKINAKKSSLRFAKSLRNHLKCNTLTSLSQTRRSYIIINITFLNCKVTYLITCPLLY